MCPPALVDLAKPLSGAKYLRMETFQDPKIAPGQRQPWFPWPYIEGLTMLAAQAVRQAQLFGIPDVTLAEVTGILGRGVGR